MNNPEQYKKLAKDKSFIDKIFHDLIKDYVKIEGQTPHAVFMAGSPGAGKTEVVNMMTEGLPNLSVILNIDNFREYFSEYEGHNASDFQSAVTVLLNKLLDKIFSLAKGGDKYSFILDATFAYSDSVNTVRRCLDRGYKVVLFFVHQDPELAWTFTVERGKKEGRVVPRSSFDKSIDGARKNVIIAKERFGDDLEVHVIYKNYKNEVYTVDRDVSASDLEKILIKKYNEDIKE